MRYDRLGLNKVLVSVDGDFKNHVLPEREVLLPTLDEIAADERFIELARRRARALAQQIRNRRKARISFPMASCISLFCLTIQ